MKHLNNRTRRVGENIRAVLAKQIMLRENFILELGEKAIITVTEVQPSSDLRHAKVFISCIGDEPEKIVKSLNENASLFSKLVAQQIKTKYSPKLLFYKDCSFDQAKKIDEIIKHNK